MNERNALVVFQDKKIRRVWRNNEWHFSVVDIVGALSESKDPRNYWKVLKHRLTGEGSEAVTKCNQLKLPASDGKLYCCQTGTAGKRLMRTGTRYLSIIAVNQEKKRQ